MRLVWIAGRLASRVDEHPGHDQRDTHDLRERRHLGQNRGGARQPGAWPAGSAIHGMTDDEPPTPIPATIGGRTAQPPIMRQEVAHHIWSRPQADTESHPASRMLDRPAVAKCVARYHFVTRVGPDESKVGLPRPRFRAEIRGCERRIQKGRPSGFHL